MAIKEEKKFKLLPDGKLQIDIASEDTLFIPVGKENVTIGKYTQTTIQIVEKDRVDDLWKFIEGSKNQADTQLIALNKQAEALKNTPDFMPDDLRNKIAKHLAKKSGKASALDLKELNEHLRSTQKKRQVEQQKKFILVHVENINKDYFAMKKVLKK